MPFENTKKCQHTMASGRKCAAPALKRSRYCVFHSRTRQQSRRILRDTSGQPRLELPVLEDANSVQLALMQVIQMLASQRMDPKIAGSILYALQTAAINLRRKEFEAADPKTEKDQAVLDALISMGKHLDDPVPDRLEKDLERLKAANYAAHGVKVPEK